MKKWISEKAKKITNGYKNPFTGETVNEDDLYAHFVCFASKVSDCEKYDSFDEFLKSISLNH